MRKNIASWSILPFLALFSVFSFSNGADILRQSESIRDGVTLTSSSGTFVLGFFSPGSSTKRYLGIWFSVDKNTVVWVANRDKPLNDSSGILRFDGTNNLILTDNSSTTFWSTGKTSSSPTSAKLKDNGNLVLIQGSSEENYLWQSFDYPTDTLLPGMKVGPDKKAGRDRILTSWKNDSDPSPGQYIYMLDTRGVLQPFLLNNSNPIYRSGPWNGLKFSGNKAMSTYTNYTFTVGQNEGQPYYEYEVTTTSILARLVVEASGKLKRYQWDPRVGIWQKLWATEDICDNYATCGPNSICSGDASLLCRCFSGFNTKNPVDWNIKNWSGGCARNMNLTCGDGDDFLPVKALKLPDTGNSTGNTSLNINECRAECLRNCSCTAYSSMDVRNGESGCIMWFGDLIDVRSFAENKPDLYLRLTKSEIEAILGKASNKKKKVVIISVTLAGALVSVFLAVLGCCACRKRTNHYIITAVEGGTTPKNNGGPTDENNELTVFDLAAIVSATNNFAEENKIGEGAFGPVYKGILRDGMTVAVKRPSSQSGERMSEFMNEVGLIAKLQHRNLVRLLGCCTENSERLLIYEYVPNGSLDFFIFGKQEMRQFLSWKKRLSVITGVARGLLYLHQDSRLKIIHRDLKAANILLDEDMSPRISDFGTAKIVERNQMDDETIKIVGTIGYMAPEYLLSGNFSEKSDVFSFGVLVLEIISGRRNRFISPKNLCMELLVNAWTLCDKDQTHSLLDGKLTDPGHLLYDIIRCIRVGLLCVQECSDKRPSMEEVVLMLANKNAVPPKAETPGFFRPTTLSAASFWFSNGCESPLTERALTITNLEGR